MCRFEDKDKPMSFESCNLFTRSITTQGIGYTFNNEIEKKMLKKDYRNSAFSPNIRRIPSLITSGSSEASLQVVIENNMEYSEIFDDMTTKTGMIHKPKKILVSIHDPKEPSDTKFGPSTSIKIHLGHSITFLITPKAREIDESGKQL